MPPALEHPPQPIPPASAALAAVIARAIDEGAGWIPFSRFMELALYAPQLGYYTGGSRQLGASGDFTTAPEMSPLFARALARQVADLFADLPAHITEFGPGSGILAAELLLALEAHEALPVKYELIELSAPLAALQRQTIGARAPHLLKRCHWRQDLAPRIDGVVIGNEVLDAMPADIIVWRRDTWLQRGVGVAARANEAATPTLVWVDRPLNDALACDLERHLPSRESWPEGYATEISLHVDAFVTSLAERLRHGVALFFDYGFPADEYYHAQRSGGTLMAHYQHRAHADLLARPGDQDLTCHVDFSAVARTACEAGCTLLGYASQARFLINCDIVSLLEADPSDAARWLPQSNALQRLLSEAEMGELFKVIAFGRGTDGALAGFHSGDRSASLD